MQASCIAHCFMAREEKRLDQFHNSWQSLIFVNAFIVVAYLEPFLLHIFEVALGFYIQEH